MKNKVFKNYLKKNDLLKMLILSMIKLPTPMSINMWWNSGSILGVLLIIQIISGFLLSMHYCPNIEYAFVSIVHIVKDVNWGWLMRLIHSNGASFYFIFMFIHIGRGLYYNSFKLAHVWMIGVTIFLLSMATAFLGYVLPWGQMSFWGATVITNLLSAIPYIGLILVEWIWGGFSINNATLNRFFSLHFILPLIILLFVIVHLYFLHLKGSNNSLGMNSKFYMLSFHPYFVIKDMLGFIMILLIFFFLVFQYPYYLGDPDNFKMADSMVTPNHIKPEWYFLFAYSILRAIPNKLGGVIALVSSILILYIMPLHMNYFMKTLKFYPLGKIFYWMFINNFILLTWLGGQLIEYPYMELNLYFTMFYFTYFLISPFLNIIWDKIIYN